MEVVDLSSSEDEYSDAQFVPCALCRQACQRMRDAPLPHGQTYPVFYKKITKAMVPPTSHRSGLAVPKRFYQRYFQFSECRPVTIQDPTGRRWHIDIHKDKQGFFQFPSIGWNDFARRNHVKLGDLVLFKLVANSYLKVQVFSTDGLLKKK
ncbi:hypothetical protein O6H91_09G062100 [Diphasiastrum complanatum]|uniref:Uncharacterized protein n=2 Tax=Diphasiastrum complanatum TaxID=34168 RepID=A0ACC2CLT4_DIPCM|nr:hypothetical protein O6H91_09G019500 [Diphasiastrum complanatum]KAJ7544025.1 hypothetical protein O6H91_09G062100 [Diphasiastrum complanatum]